MSKEQLELLLQLKKLRLELLHILAESKQAASVVLGDKL